MNGSNRFQQHGAEFKIIPEELNGVNFKPRSLILSHGFR
jgi:hypothetical protein